ncbi:glycerol-3-phosphate acyltransferase mitochondrial [Limosa lapponica baueri]|uniref:Glycerol-3-phosphate acyltransferase mitochondrial n=1 Tax=Limosa lapponica baueri TaxID=1758121 RepID=A0A2I0T3I7_LIMLA|nr:glycerol-3-phosphate acyltransferase mitochondrial [Limosa lapponica baueri]
MWLSPSLPRYRGWLVRRICGFLAIWGWEVPVDTPGDLPARICRSRRVRDVATSRSRGSSGDGKSHQRWKEKILQILAEIQAPLSLLMLRLCNWALLKLLNRLFLSVQLHRGQLAMVLRAARTEFVAKNLIKQSCRGKRLEELLLPTILGTCPSQLDTQKAELWSPSPTAATGLGVEEEILVTKLGLHSLSDGVACSAVMAVGITAALLLHKHQEVRQGGVRVSFPSEQDFRSHARDQLILFFLQGVFLSRLMRDFAWLLEEILLRQHDVGFSGQLRALVQHSLALLRAHLTLYHLAPIGDILVVPEASVVALWELGHHSAAILPIFASEAVGACAIHALLMEMLPFLGVTVGPSGIMLSQDELLRKILELLRLLPPNLLGLQPCQPLDCLSQDILDKLLLCGLLEAEEPESERWVCDLAPRPFCSRGPWAGMDFTDSDSDGQDEVPKRCFKLSEPQGSPGLLLFLCRLLRPVLRTYASAVAFLDRPSWPQPGRTPTPAWATASPPTLAPPP